MLDIKEPEEANPEALISASLDTLGIIAFQATVMAVGAVGDSLSNRGGYWRYPGMFFNSINDVLETVRHSGTNVTSALVGMGTKYAVEVIGKGLVDTLFSKSSSSKGAATTEVGNEHISTPNFS